MSNHRILVYFSAFHCDNPEKEYYVSWVVTTSAGKPMKCTRCGKITETETKIYTLITELYRCNKSPLLRVHACVNCSDVVENGLINIFGPLQYSSKKISFDEVESRMLRKNIPFLENALYFAS